MDAKKYPLLSALLTAADGPRYFVGRSGNQLVEGPQIHGLIEKLRAMDLPEKNKKFLENIKKFWALNHYLSKDQYESLKKMYEEQSF